MSKKKNATPQTNMKKVRSQESSYFVDKPIRRPNPVMTFDQKHWRS